MALFTYDISTKLLQLLKLFTLANYRSDLTSTHKTLFYGIFMVKNVCKVPNVHWISCFVLTMRQLCLNTFNADF